jgi:multidrug efflux pump subunit AcrA (membrane-fusion protein)
MKKIRWKSILLVFGIVAIGILGMSLLGSSTPTSQKRAIQPQIRTVNTEKIHFDNLELEVTGNGIIESQSTLDVISEVSGKIDFAKNNLKDGTFVKKGEIVLRVDSREIENTLYSLRSDFLNSVAALLPDLKVESQDLYNKWFTYFSEIDIHSKIPELPAVSDLQEKIKLSSRQIFTKYYAVKNEEILFSKYVVRAPYSGYLKSAGVIENSFISRGQHLFRIEDVYNLEIAVPLLVDEFNQIHFGNGTTVEISSDNTDKKLEGHLVRKDPVLDKNSQSLRVYVTFSNNKMIPDFLAGNYVNIKISGKKLKNVAAIPRHLVDNENYVYTIENGKLSREKLEVLEVQNDKVIVANRSNHDLEIVTTVLQKPLLGMQIQSLDYVTELDSTDINDSVAVN